MGEPEAAHWTQKKQRPVQKALEQAPSHLELQEERLRPPGRGPGGKHPSLNPEFSQGSGKQLDSRARVQESPAWAVCRWPATAPRPRDWLATLHSHKDGLQFCSFSFSQDPEGPSSLSTLRRALKCLHRFFLFNIFT